MRHCAVFGQTQWLGIAGQGLLWQLEAYVEGTCGGCLLVVPVDGWWHSGIRGCGVRMLGGMGVVPVVLVRAAVVLCVVGGAGLGEVPCQ